MIFGQILFLTLIQLYYIYRQTYDTLNLRSCINCIIVLTYHTYISNYMYAELVINITNWTMLISIGRYRQTWWGIF